MKFSTIPTMKTCRRHRPLLTTAALLSTLVASSIQAATTLDAYCANGNSGTLICQDTSTTTSITLSGGSLTFSNCVISNCGAISVADSGSLTFNNVIFVNPSSLTTALSATGNVTITINNSVFNKTTVSSNGGTITINNSNFYADSNSAANDKFSTPISSTNGGSLNINGGTITGYPGILVSSGASLSISNVANVLFSANDAFPNNLNKLSANDATLSISGFTSYATYVDSQNSNVSISSTTFSNFKPFNNKAAVTCSSGALNMTNVNFNNLTISSGSQTSDIFLTGVNPVNYNGGYIYHEGIGSVLMNGPGLAGTFSNLYFKSPAERQDQGAQAMIMVQSNPGKTFNFQNITMDGCLSTWGTLNAGTFVMDSISIVNIPNQSRNTNPGLMYLNNMVVNLTNSIIQNINTTSSITLTNGVTLNVNNLTATNFISTSPLLSPAAATMNIANSLFSNGQITGSPLMAIGQNVVLNMQNSTITGMLMSGSTQFGDIITNAGGVMNLQDTIISNNIADTLCSTIQSKGNSVLNLLGSTQITGNTAPKCGGAITLSENATLTINSEQVVLSGNIADKGSMLCINNGYNISHLTISNISPSSSGSVYLSTKMLAQTFSSTASYTTLQSLSSGVVFNSIPVALAFADSDFAGVASTGVKSYSLLPSKQIPKFKVKEIDYFNNSIADISNGPTFIELGNLSPVIYLNESTGTVNVLGETSKVLPIGADYFDDISLNTTGSNLTNFILNIYAYTGTMDFDNSTTWLTINVTITNCDGVNNTNYTDSNGMSKCYDFCPVNNSFRVGFGSIGIVFAVISGVVIFAMKNMGVQEMLKIPSIAERRLSIIMSVVGSLISFLAIAINFDPSSRSCQSWSWLWTIGFFLTMTSLATFTIANVRRQGKAKILRKLAELKEEKNTELLKFYELDVWDEIKIFVASQIPVLVFLLAWQFAQPSTYVNVLGNNCIINNQCSTSTFNSLSSIFRIGALLANMLLIVNYRKVAKNVKTIAFVLVNWLIFEIIAIVLPAVVYYAANTVFAFTCVCVFVPNAVSIFAMLYSDAEEDDFGESSSIGMSTGGTSNASSTSGTGKNKGTIQNSNSSKGQSQQKSAISNNQSQQSQIRTTEASNNAASELGSVAGQE